MFAGPLRSHADTGTTSRSRISGARSAQGPLRAPAKAPTAAARRRPAARPRRGPALTAESGAGSHVSPAPVPRRRATVPDRRTTVRSGLKKISFSNGPWCVSGIARGKAGHSVRAAPRGAPGGRTLNQWVKHAEGEGPEGRHIQTLEVRRATGRDAAEGTEGEVIASGTTGRIVADDAGVQIFAGLAPDLFAANLTGNVAFRAALAAGKFAPDLFHDGVNYFQNRNVTAIGDGGAHAVDR
jgi:hypothetical protein